MLTFKGSLIFSIRTRNVTTFRTFLASVSGVNIFDLDTFSFSFISKKLLKLKEIPFMQFCSLLFTKSDNLSNDFKFSSTIVLPGVR